MATTIYNGLLYTTKEINRNFRIKINGIVDGKKVKFGACSDYSEENGFFDKGYFIRKQTYDDYALFCSELDKLLSNRDVVIKRVSFAFWQLYTYLHL